MQPEQSGRFLVVAEQTRFGVLFLLAFHTGCRPGELFALKWSDLDASARTLRIQRTIVWPRDQGGEWYLTDPKTALSRRTLPLTEALLERLAQQRTRQLEDRMKAGKAWADHGFNFADEAGGPYSQANLRYRFKEILKAAGLPTEFKPYDARRTTAALLMAGGTNPKVVSERLGHTGISITLETYTDIHPACRSRRAKKSIGFKSELGTPALSR
jgi:integrase